uniref:Homeobox domain-containing protein n=1 Tax=Steinernema glaseri TaxID=37863 RepID=A0A1I7ZZ32_9BILA
MLSKLARESSPSRTQSQKTVRYLLEKDFDEPRRAQLKEDLRQLNVSLRELELSASRDKKRKRKTVTWTNNPLYKKASLRDDIETDCESKSSELSKSMDSGYKSDTASLKVDAEEGPVSGAQMTGCDEFHEAAEQLIEAVRRLQPKSEDESIAHSLKDCEVELTKFSI